MNNFKDAEEFCTKCLKQATSLNSPSMVKAGKQCLKDVKEVKAKVEKETAIKKT